jgi:molecular chaperone GrpE
MTEDTQEETATTQTNEPDDKRFEVKWRKKNEPATATETVSAEAATSDAASQSVAGLERQLEEERERVRNLQDRWQRAAADLANLRRRTEQEKGEIEQFATMLLVQELLPVLDNFERALATIPGNLAMLTWVQGVLLIERHMRAILERQGLAPIEAVGQPFNAYQHEAIAEAESAEAAPGTILQEYQKGYTMHGRVIRPSLVEVARQPAGGEAVPATPEPTGEAQAERIAEEAETDNTGP